MADMKAAGEAVLAAQPFSRWMGTELFALGPGSAELRLPLRAEHLQQHGFVHGGVVSYLADNALTFAGGSVLGPQVLTAGFLISFFRPAQGDTLVARASVVASGKRQAVCRCEVFARTGDGEVLCAAAQGTISSAEAGRRSAGGA